MYYICSMKIQETEIQQTILGVLSSLLYCLALQKAIKYFAKIRLSICCKKIFYCFLLQFHCISIAKVIAFLSLFFAKKVTFFSVT